MRFTLSDGTVVEAGLDSPIRLAGETAAPDADAVQDDEIVSDDGQQTEGTQSESDSDASEEAAEEAAADDAAAEDAEEEAVAISEEDDTEADETDGTETGTELSEILEEPDPPPDPDPLPLIDLLLPAGICALAGFVLALLIFLVLWALGRKGSGPLKRLQKPASVPVRATGTVTAQKLHEQGARNSQQDSFFVSESQPGEPLLAIVADGMGGLSDGDLVSQTAVRAAATAFYAAPDSDPQRQLVGLVQAANAAVNDVLGYNGLYQSGSTFVAGQIRDGAFYYISIGDSRISLFRDGVLYHLNREHVYRNELYLRAVNEGGSLAAADSHPKAAGLSSFLGMGELKYIDIPVHPVEIRPGDRFVLMSDGVYNALTDEELAAALAQPQAAQLLKTAIQAKNYQNQDNYTAVILDC